ncbi:putative Enniatin synthase [Glarea lozoyensis 74030]|uniref:Putative Enniatin synthase n=1 Tax=Glarea lozoyensis (strain ATCC 74030 / MF5533) TaxID=1104152 RepID=H0ERV2_GLAL7|nr:putative Enniatin synthase [Glarea lozoyensis 74030]
MEIFVALLNGSTLCIVNIPETVSAWDAVFVIGDRFNSRDAAAAKALVRSRVYNGYGPTENGIVSTVYSVREHELFVNGVPIGRTVTNSGAYVMDRNQQLVPVGVMGELVVTGEGLARGYTNPALDVDRFVFINIGDEHVRAYRTGDKVRIQPEGGQLEFFGRIDQQFKIRGHRIESAEIENSLLNLSALRDAAVVVTQKEEQQELEIIAFVVAEENNSGDVQQKVNGHSGYPANQFTMQIGNDVRKRLQKLLPTYMIPARIIVLDQMPLNINGKIDRKELERRAKGENSLEDKPTSLHVAPRNDIEVILCEEYADVLGITKVGITGNFFDLGGHSLMATKLAARLSQRLSTRVSVKEVFDKPMVGDLAATIRKGSSPHKPIPRMNYAGPVEQSFAQGRMWFLDQLIHDWSNAILRQELSRFYSAALRGQDPLSQATQLPIQYWEFAVWQKQDAQKAEHQRQLEYWTKKLTDSTPAELLSDHQRPAVPSGYAGEVQFVIEGSVFDDLPFRATHYRLTGVQDANIGTPVANRDRLELEEIIGFFVNTQCLRIQVNEEDTFEGLLLQVRSTVAEALANQDVPFERLVATLSPGSRDMSRNPLVQLMFALHSQPDLDTIQLEGLKAERVPSAVSTRFDAEFHLSQGDKGLKGSVLFAADLFEHLRSLGLFEIEKTEYPKESSVVDIFGEQVVACPDAIAVVDSTSQLTYSQLDKKSNKLAAWLRRRRLPAETPIGVFATRSCQGIVAFLGILKANLTYLPLDIKTPIARIETILSAAITGNKLVLLSSGVIIPNLQLPDVEMAPRVAHLNNIAFDVSVWEILVALLNKGTLICIDYLTVLDGEALANVFARQQVRVAFFPTALLKQYLADKPSALAHLELLHVGGERLDGRDAIEVRSLIPSVYNAYGPTESHVCTMYKLRNNEDYTNGVPIGRAVSNTGVYIMDSQQRLVSKGVMGELIITGDALARGYKDSALDLNRFVEVQLESDSPPVRAYRTGDLVRYRPKDFIIEAFGRMDQQIKIRGHRIELAEVEHALLNRAAVRDATVVIRKDENQTLEIVAFVLIRVDFANKGLSNGDTIKQSPFGKDVAKQPGNHNGKIEKDIRNQLKAHLPSYMIPTMIIILDQMPLNPNGKVDRTRLTQMAESVPKNTAVTRAAKPEVIKGAPKTQIVVEHVAVLSDLEAALCEEFGNVLGVEVNTTDNFFDLGGHSLLTIKLATRISRRLNLRVSIKDIFDEPVPIELANKIERMQLQSHRLQNGEKKLHMFRPSA